jgi:hypothetical protein
VVSSLRPRTSSSITPPSRHASRVCPPLSHWPPIPSGGDGARDVAHHRPARPLPARSRRIRHSQYRDSDQFEQIGSLRLMHRVNRYTLGPRTDSADTSLPRMFEAGAHRLIWDGRGRPGGTSAPGLCFVRLRTDPRGMEAAARPSTVTSCKQGPGAVSDAGAAGSRVNQSALSAGVPRRWVMVYSCKLAAS